MTAGNQCPTEPCLGCRWGWPVMMCRSGRWHHAIDPRQPGEVLRCEWQPGELRLVRETEHSRGPRGGMLIVLSRLVDVT